MFADYQPPSVDDYSRQGLRLNTQDDGKDGSLDPEFIAWPCGARKPLGASRISRSGGRYFEELVGFFEAK